MNVLRGTGPEGLGGIPPVRGRLMRPLLNTPREEMEAYLSKHGLGHVEDETNESLVFARNRLRRLVLPELEKINPALRNNVARTAAIVRRENDFLDELAAGYLPPEGTQIPCRQLMGAPEALQPRMVRILASRLETGKKDWTAGHIEMILALAKTPRSGMLSLPSGAMAVCRNGLLELEVADGAADGAAELTEGSSCWNGWAVSASRVEVLGSEEDGALYLTESPKGKWEVDTWRSGEGLELPGSRGKRSVKRLLTERGIPPQERKTIPCIRLNGELVAVYGVGTDRHYLPKDDGKAIKINFYKENM